MTKINWELIERDDIRPEDIKYKLADENASDTFDADFDKWVKSLSLNDRIMLAVKMNKIIYKTTKDTCSKAYKEGVKYCKELYQLNP